LQIFSSALVDRVRRSGNVWKLPGGELVLPEVFGFCRGVKRALIMLDRAVAAHGSAKRLFLLGQIIHNPWVNDHFSRLGVRILSGEKLDDLESIVSRDDCAIIPAFGVPLPIEDRLRAIGCQIVDTTCTDVRRLWSWAGQAAERGYGVLVFGRAMHDETVVIKSRLQAAGGRYLVVGTLAEAARFCDMISGAAAGEDFARAFGPGTTNASSLEPFLRLAQVSQTTMLYDQTMEVRELVRRSFAARFGKGNLTGRLLFQPTVCRATQARQAAAVELCRGGCGLVIVVGGFGSSNTRHLFELARGYCPAYFIEDATAILSAERLATFDPAAGTPVVAEGWLPTKRPLRIGVLAGASSPEVVVGEVLERLASFLGAASAAET
jgi:4-hydroxy-3-methylbut-2-enyl diphosphate reductase